MGMYSYSAYINLFARLLVFVVLLACCNSKMELIKGNLQGSEAIIIANHNVQTLD